jgi:hypothetical protein
MYMPWITLIKQFILNIRRSDRGQVLNSLSRLSRTRDHPSFSDGGKFYTAVSWFESTSNAEIGMQRRVSHVFKQKELESQGPYHNSWVVLKGNGPRLVTNGIASSKPAVFWRSQTADPLLKECPVELTSHPRRKEQLTTLLGKPHRLSIFNRIKPSHCSLLFNSAKARKCSWSFFFLSKTPKSNMSHVGVHLM